MGKSGWTVGIVGAVGTAAFISAFKLTSIASVTLAEGAKRVPAGQAALLSALETPLAPVLAFMVFSEMPNVETFVGGSIVLAAILFSTRGSLR